MPDFMKARQWMITIALLTLVVATVVGAILTRNWGADTPPTARTTAIRKMLVDERPLKTARSMAKMASGWDERNYANEALRLGDHEVDLAFADALRDAANSPAAATPQAREMYARVAKADAQAKASQARIDQLNKQIAKANGSTLDDLKDQLDLATAQLELDQDELGDAKEDLVRSGADPESIIQRQYERHEASSHAADAAQVQAADNPDVNYRAGSLWSQFSAWSTLRAKATQLAQAREEAAGLATNLSSTHDALEQAVKAESATKQTLRDQAAGHAGIVGSARGGAALASLRRFSQDQKDLSDLDKRIQTLQELQNAYANWIGLVQGHQRTAVHGMIRSALWILLIVLAIYLAGLAIDHHLTAAGMERTRLHTLRVVIRFAVQAVGVVLILFVVIGVPQQTPTILGFAGAGLTVALKDFIVGFFGWFVLMGKNGLRVGDWVEINGVAGEVIEINLLRTVLLETGNWATTGHPTGRKVAFVNSYAIEGHFFNFTTSGQWLWDEIEITVPANQDPYPLIEAIQKTVTKETEANAKAAEQEWERADSHYKVRSVSPTPAVNLRPTPTGIEIHIRYVTRAEERVAMRARLNQALVQLLRGKGAAESVSSAK
ncbi:MAG TPA: mechanosensitive ion channel domain-containing protein [Terriglobales bacterium]|nr:mechanosensitive ion channel domain-containing protein [Terriglobales bacterium]